MALTLIKLIRNKNGHCKLCTDPDDEGNMIGCNDCKHWLHKKCAGVLIDPPEEQEWICPRCRIIEDKLLEEEQLSKKIESLMIEIITNPNSFCQFCYGTNESHNMIRCKECQQSFHKSCISFSDPTETVSWVCPKCCAIEFGTNLNKFGVSEEIKRILNRMLEALKKAKQHIINVSENGATICRESL